MLSIAVLAYLSLAVPLVTQPVWQTVLEPNPNTSIYGKAAVIGPNSDIIAITGGSQILHYNVTDNTAVYNPLPAFQGAYAIWSAKGSNIAWAGGDAVNSIDPGLIYKLDFKNPGWKAVRLPFISQYTIRDIHGTSDDNLYVACASGESLPLKRSAILYFNGKNWSKKLENQFNGFTSIFARGNQVFVGGSDGTILYSNDQLKTFKVMQEGTRNGAAITSISGTSTSVFFTGPDGLRVLKDTSCIPKKGFFGMGKVECVLNLGNPDRAIYALATNLPGMTSNQVFTVGGLWDGTKFIQPQDIRDGSFHSLLVSKGDLYAVGDNFYLAKKKL